MLTAKQAYWELRWFASQIFYVWVKTPIWCIAEIADCRHVVELPRYERLRKKVSDWSFESGYTLPDVYWSDR